MPDPDHPSGPAESDPDARRMTQLASGAIHVLRALRLLRRARDEGTLSSEQYEAAVDAIAPEPDQPPGS